MHTTHNAESVCISIDDLVRFLKENNHEPTFVVTSGELEEQKPAAAPAAAAGTDKEGHILGITVKKTANFPEWYTQAIIRGGMVEYYDISGCYIVLPPSYFIWESFQEWFNQRIKKVSGNLQYLH